MSGFHHSGFRQDLNPATQPRAGHASPPHSDAGSFEARPANAGHWMNPTEHEAMEEPKSASRRRRPSDNDHVKHRRTRNGCYTCRSRRVKCDELRPICQRCAKGKRECNYPEPRENPKLSGGTRRNPLGTAAADSHSSSGSDDSAGPRCKKNEPQKASSSSKGPRPKAGPSQHRSPSSAEQPQTSIEEVKLEGSLSPSTDFSSTAASSVLDKSEKFSSVSTDGSQEDKTWLQLPQDLQYYLDYHKTQLNFHHYKFKHDANHFLHHTLVEQALTYDPLLYAVAGFAAFHSTVNRPSGKMQDFLGYHNKSVSLLRKSLRDNQRHTDATMLTILQLATFEDYLGDLVSLLGHQKAAYGMLTELYSSHSIMETEERRKILAWYLRFDVMGGLIAGYSAVLGREWFLTMESYYHQQSLSYPMSIDCKIEATIASNRLLAGDLALLYAQLPRGDISVEDFARECARYAEQLDTWKENLDPVFRDESYLVKSFGDEVRQDPQDIVDPYMPGGLYRGALFTFNYMLMDWLALNLMHKYKTAILLRREVPREVRASAMEICRLFETIEYWPESPPGAVLKAQGSLGLAIVFLPRDEKHIMWCRRKLDKIESLGHIYPATLRHKMADEWGLPGVNDGWLPDESAIPPVVRSVKVFVEDRLPQAGRQSRSEDQRNIQGIFSKLSFTEDSQPKEESDSTRSLPASPALNRSQTLLDDQPSLPGIVDGVVGMISDDAMLQQSQDSFYRCG